MNKPDPFTPCAACNTQIGNIRKHDTIPGTKLTLKDHVTLVSMSKNWTRTNVTVDKKFFNELYEKLLNAKEIIIK